MYVVNLFLFTLPFKNCAAYNMMTTKQPWVPYYFHCSIAASNTLLFVHLQNTNAGYLTPQCMNHVSLLGHTALGTILFPLFRCS